MIWWILRGLRKGRVTTGYPRKPEPAPVGYRGRVVVRYPEAGVKAYEELCPTGAISVASYGRLALDRARCVLCGACVGAAPETFAFESDYRTAARTKPALVVGHTARTEDDSARATLADQAGALKRSIHVRHVDAGSDGGEEWEIAALTNPYYDMQRLGLFFTLAPRHADVLLVTGAVTPSMTEPLRRAYEAMPFPKAVVAAGTDACSGGFARAADMGGVDTVLPVDVYVPGSPPAPIALLHGLLLAAGIVTDEAAA